MFALPDHGQAECGEDPPVKVAENQVAGKGHDGGFLVIDETADRL